MFRNQRFSTGLFIGLAVLGCALLQAVPVWAQSNRDGIYYGGSVVGGVFVDPDGLCAEAPQKEIQEIGRTLARLLEPVPDDLNQPAAIRKISLKKLDDAIRNTIERRAEFPDTIRYLGGLTSLRYIVVVPEENDLLLVGAAEGWKADHAGNIIGKTSGRPVFRLEDLLTIFRSWNVNERPSVITCSIDPTPEALARIAKVDAGFGVVTRENARAFAAAQEDAYGMNVVTIRGVPDNSRFAKILVAADYKMKRIGLGQQPSMVRGLPSYISLIRGSQKQINPRFWLAPEYGTVSHDSKKLTWELGTVKVKAMTEDEYVDIRSGSRQSSGKSDPAAISWCNKMNANYDTLGKIDPVFGDLKNCMELAIAVALIRREGLLEKANCKLPAFDDATTLKTEPLPAPKRVPSRATIAQSGRATIVACGGVEINPFATLEKSTLDSKMDAEYETLTKTDGQTWWSK